MITYEYLSQPIEEPIDVSEIKDYFKIEHALEDELLSGLIKAARSQVESYLNKTLLLRNIVVVFSQESKYLVPIIPIQEVVNIQYYSNNELEDLDESLYRLRKLTGELLIDKMPADIDADSDLYVQLVTGVETSEQIDSDIIQAIKLIVIDNYEQRSNGVKTLTTAAEKILNPHRNLTCY